MNVISQLIDETRRRIPGKTAILNGEFDLTYEELALRTNLLLNQLVLGGVAPADRVAVVHRSELNGIVSLAAVLERNAFAVPLTPTEFLEEFARGTLAGRYHSVITDRETQASAGIPDTPKLGIPLLGVESGAAFDHSRRDTTGRQADGAGQQGGVILRALAQGEADGGIVYSAALLRRLSMEQKELGATHHDLREYVVPSLLQPFGLLRLLGCLACGGTLILPDGPASASELTARVFQNRCNALAVNGPLLLELLEDHRALSDAEAAHIRFLVFDDPALSPTTKKLLLRRFPNAHLWISYGVPEAPSISWADYREHADRLQSIGTVTGNEDILILADDGTPCGRGQAGSIAIRGSRLASGYLRGAEIVSLPLDGEQRFVTTDIGTVDTRGALTWLGKREDAITRGDKTIFPQIIEEKIHEAYPDCEICVIGIPDPEGLTGEIPVLCYSPNDGNRIIPSELSARLAKRLDKSFIPRVVFRVTSFPRIGNNISRSTLKEMILQGQEIS